MFATLQHAKAYLRTVSLLLSAAMLCGLPPAAEAGALGSAVVRAFERATAKTVVRRSAGRLVTTPRVVPGRPFDVTLSKQRHPQTARHVLDAQRRGQPSILTLERSGAAARRRQALRDVGRRDWPHQRGLDRDEYPMAMTREGGANADVRFIGAGDNRGAGRTIARQLRGSTDGTRFRVQVVE